MIYLDNNATTRIAPEARAAMLPFLDEAFGNPSSQNRLGRESREAIFRARQSVAAAVKASPNEVMFTSCATESNHFAILGAIGIFSGARNHVVATRVEHPASLKLLESLAARKIEVTLLDVDEHGQIDPEQAIAAITDRTALVSMIWANNETGVILPIEPIATHAKSRGALFHTDAVQAIGRLPFNWQQSGVDLLSFSGHKLHAPKGVGALLIRKGVNLPSLIFGSQERNRRGGTENVMAIVGLGAAMQLIDPNDSARMRSLRDRFERRILEALPFARINGGGSRVCNTSNIRFGQLNAEELQSAMEREGVIASLGSACQAGGNRPSHVLCAMGLDAASLQASLRFSLSRHTCVEEIDAAGSIVINAALELALRSPQPLTLKRKTA